MLNETTINKLYEMKLGVMAQTFKDQITDSNLASLSFEERLGLIVMPSGIPERTTASKGLLGMQAMSSPMPVLRILSIMLTQIGQGTDFFRLATCNYITDCHNIIILGATGNGKTYSQRLEYLPPQFLP